MKISAVIPTYKRPKLLVRAIESVLAQTRAVDEIVVVDDGSGDETRVAAAAFGAKINYVFQQNRGLAGARNTGIRSASGDWIALLDDDDVWLPDAIRKLEEGALSSPHAVLVYGNYWSEDVDGSRRLTRMPEPSRLWPALRRTNPLVPSSVMIRKDAVMEVGGFNESIRVCEDWDLWVRLRSKHPFAATSEPVTVYYRTAQSLSSNFDRMLSTSEQILETTLLAGVSGWRRALWRRRIRSAQLASAAITANECKSPRERELIVRSIVQWPFPSLLPRRYKALARVLLGPQAYAVLTSLFRSASDSRVPQGSSKDS
jgi:glycosyltransferase involved in cell wall biosynthesis